MPIQNGVDAGIIHDPTSIKISPFYRESESTVVEISEPEKYGVDSLQTAKDKRKQAMQA